MFVATIEVLLQSSAATRARIAKRLCLCNLRLSPRGLPEHPNPASFPPPVHPLPRLTHHFYPTPFPPQSHHTPATGANKRKEVLKGPDSSLDLSAVAVEAGPAVARFDDAEGRTDPTGKRCDLGLYTGLYGTQPIRERRPAAP